MVAAAAGAANVAFLFAGIVYVCIGLAYTELAAAYPVAGGGQFFVMRALGDFMGFVAGWAVLLDFTIDISLFALFSIGYISALVPWLADPHNKAVYFLLVLGVIMFLTILNIRGVRQSSRLNEIVATIDVINETIILLCGFALAWHPQFLIHAMIAHWPTTNNLLLAISLAIISFVGLESISHAAEETYQPASIIPRTSVGLILTILIFALAYSNLVLGMVTTGPNGVVPLIQVVGSPENQDKAVAVLAGAIPYVGLIFAAYVPIIGAMLVLISSNSGVFGASRIAYSMGQYRLLPSWFQRISSTTKTPVGTIIVFSGVAAIELVAAYLQKEQALTFLADLYAFGAALSYTLVFVALIVLRFTDAAAPRQFKMPWNIPIVIGGRHGDVSLVSVIGLIGISCILVFTLLTHPTGRIAGPAWVIFGIVFYLIYRKRSRQPLFRSSKRNWEKMHEETLTNAGELDMLDAYRAAIAKERTTKEEVLR